MPSGQARILDSCPPLQPPPGPCCTCVQAAHPPTPVPGTCGNHIPNPSADTSLHLRPVSKVRTEDGRWRATLRPPPSHYPQDSTSGPVNAGCGDCLGYGFSDHIYLLSLLSQERVSMSLRQEARVKAVEQGRAGLLPTRTAQPPKEQGCPELPGKTADCNGGTPAPRVIQRHVGLEGTRRWQGKEIGGSGPETLPLRGSSTALGAAGLPVGPQLGQESHTRLSGHC